MHKGRKVMDDSPRNLLERNIEKYVLEVAGAGLTKDLGDISFMQTVRIDRSQETTRVYSDDIERLKAVANRLQHVHYYVRQTNLEDVFLKATGRALNERQ
jgi:lipooligosaccharide transport system ATP-binding protein